MARKCKDCPKTEEELYEEHVREREAAIKGEEPKQIIKKSYFFPNEWVKIEADSYEEALNILHSNKE